MTFSLASFERFVTLFLVFSIIAVGLYVYALYEKEQQRNPTGRRLRKKVYEESPRLKALFALNKKYSFHSIPPRYYFTHECASKAEFDRIALEDIFARVIKENLTLFEGNITQIKENKRLYAEYLQEFSAIKNSVFQSEESEAYRQAELSFMETYQVKIRTAYEIVVAKSYISPMGKNSYSDSRTFQSYDIAQFITKANQMNLEQEKRRAQAEYERSLMTASLRYDILKRDKGRCVLCGASAEDGVKLHVDHILPVSKGGKTTPSNLRTLCDRCNLGKKDKYDSEGFN